jgi:hypothetical protein
VSYVRICSLIFCCHNLQSFFSCGTVSSDNYKIELTFQFGAAEMQVMIFFPCFWVSRGGGLPHTANPTAGGPRQSLTSQICLTPLSREVPSARTKVDWELNPHTNPLGGGCAF